MKKKFSLVHIHGIQERDKKDSHKRIAIELQKELGLDYQFDVLPVIYLNEINSNQDVNFRRMYRGKDKKLLRLMKPIRKFFINALGDALAIHYSQEEYENVMVAIHKSLLAAKSDNIVIYSQSLGNHLFSSYMWDMQKRTGIKNDKIKLWFSTGNNMRAFFHGLRFKAIAPFGSPSPFFRWFNFWSWGDPMGYPMKNVNRHYDELLTKDVHAMGVPFISHTRYNKNKKVVKTIAKEIRKL